jgi:hypothetical protein
VSPAAVAEKQGIVVSLPVNSAALVLESSAMTANLEAICIYILKIIITLSILDV